MDSLTFKLAVNRIVKNLTSASTEDEIMNELATACSKLGGFAAVCTDFVQKYAPELFAFLKDDLNATRVCMKLNVCANTTDTTAVAAEVISMLLEAPKPGECKICKVCSRVTILTHQLLVARLEGKLFSNSTVQEIEADLEKGCLKMGVFSKVCDDVVEKYLPELISVLQHDLNSTVVCEMAGICPRNQTMLRGGKFHNPINHKS